MDETLLDFTAAENNGVQAVLRAYGVEPDAEKDRLLQSDQRQFVESLRAGEITRDHILESRFPLFFKELGVEGDGLAAERLYRKQLDESAVLIDGGRWKYWNGCPATMKCTSSPTAYPRPSTAV